MTKNITLEVWGRYALFTRPEFKVERMSYDVITPSAARAIFEAIYWKPQMKWLIKEIAVLNPISFAHFQRCETAAMAHTGKSEIVAERCRQLRSSVVLRDVKYRIKAEIIALDGDRERHYATFRRRAIKGQCFTQPYLGCREFSADWRLVSDDYDALQMPIEQTKDLGDMLFDMDFSDLGNPKPKLFRVKMVNGVIIW